MHTHLESLSPTLRPSFYTRSTTSGIHPYAKLLPINHRDNIRQNLFSMYLQAASWLVHSGRGGGGKYTFIFYTGMWEFCILGPASRIEWYTARSLQQLGGIGKQGQVVQYGTSKL